MNIEVRDLSDPVARRMLQDYLGEQVIAALCSMLGPGFAIRSSNGKVLTHANWHEVRVGLLQLDQLDDAIAAMQIDIIKSGFRFFERLPTENEQILVERNGICFRTTIRQDPPEITFDYVGWV